MPFFTGLSGLSNPAGASFPKPPDILVSPSSTEKETVFVIGTRSEEDTVIFGGRVLDAPFYFMDEKWFAPFELDDGINSASAFCVDIEGHVSTETVVSVTRVARTLFRTIADTIVIDGVNVTDYVTGKPSLNRESDAGITEISFEISGMFTPEGTTWLAANKKVVYTYSDGLVSRSIEGRIDKFDLTVGTNGSRTISIVAVSHGKRLLETKINTVITGTTNGTVLKNICEKCGYKTVYVPRGYKYTGPVTANDHNGFEIVRNILFVEQWVMEELPGEQIAFYPDVAASFVRFRFNDDEVRQLGRSFDAQYIINKARIKYVFPEESSELNFNFEATLPDKSSETESGYAWFSSDDFIDAVTSYDPNSIIFFMVWSPTIDFNEIKRARLKIKFSESVFEQSTFSHSISLESFPSKKCAIGYFDLRQYHLESTVPVYYQFYVEDWFGHSYGSRNVMYESRPFVWKKLSLSGSKAATASKITSQFGVTLSENKLISEFNETWDATSYDGLPKVGSQGVVYASKFEFTENKSSGWKFDFIIELPVNDASLDTITFDTIRATANTSKKVCLANCEIVTSGNAAATGNPTIYAVRSHVPNAPIRRVDSLFIKLKGKVFKGDSIVVKINAWGRLVESDKNFVDFSKLDYRYQNDASIAALKLEEGGKVLDDGVRDAGILLSNYLSNEDQTKNLLKKIVESRCRIVEMEDLELPPLIEMGKNCLIAIDSASVGYTDLYWVTECELSGDNTSAKAYKVTSVPLSRPGTDALIYRNSFPDVALNFESALEDMINISNGMLRGVVANRKYRGMFVVDLDDGKQLKSVISRIPGIKGGETVLVAQSKEGTYVVVAVISESMDEYDEKFGSDEESGDSESLEDFSYYSAEYEEALGNVITASVVADRYDPDNGNEIPIDAAFTVELSHSIYSWYDLTEHPNAVVDQFYYDDIELPDEAYDIGSIRKIDGRQTSNNFSPFARVYDATDNVFVPCSVTRVGEEPLRLFYTGPGATVENTSTRKLLIKPQYNFIFDHKIIVYFGNVFHVDEGEELPTLFSHHHGRALQLRSLFGRATLPDEGCITAEFTVEKLFTVTELYRPNYNTIVCVLSQATPDQEAVTDPRSYAIVPDSGEND